MGARVKDKQIPGYRITNTWHTRDAPVSSVRAKVEQHTSHLMHPCLLPSITLNVLKYPCILGLHFRTSQQ